jgi:hypothetical protein
MQLEIAQRQVAHLDNESSLFREPRLVNVTSLRSVVSIAKLTRFSIDPNTNASNSRFTT